MRHLTLALVGVTLTLGAGAPVRAAPEGAASLRARLEQVHGASWMRGEEPAPVTASILAGRRLLVGRLARSVDLEGPADQVFLSYPSPNFDYPSDLYGAFVHLDPPLTVASFEGLPTVGEPGRRRPRRDFAYVEVLDPMDDQVSDVRGRLLGFGDAPGPFLSAFTDADLEGVAFDPLPGALAGGAPPRSAGSQ